MPALHDWQNFYMLTGTAAATLVGLLFVAISIGSNLPVKQARDSLRTFVNPILNYYSQALLVSCLALMPLQSSLILGGVLLVLGSINIFLSLKVCWRMLVLHSGDALGLGHWIWHFLLPLVAGILFVCTAIGFLLGEQLALLGSSLTDLLCLTIGLRNTWVLTIWLVLHRRQSSDVDPEQQANRTVSASPIA